MEEYEVSRILANISCKNWITKELFSLGWFVIVAVLLIVYAVWLKLLNKSRVIDILLFGSLSSIGFMLADVIFGNYLGFTSHGIDLFPLEPSFFIVSITVTPVLWFINTPLNGKVTQCGFLSVPQRCLWFSTPIYELGYFGIP